MIIQDELHLISGPLGTVAGLYEAAMDVIMKSAGGRPKYLAATATIRRASEQAERLYARDVSIFPPSGMTAEDSFFSREEKEQIGKGRLYIGILGQYHTPVTSLVHTAAALTQAPCDVPMSNECVDGYWTQVIFHNSRRELGKTMSLCRDDINERVKVIAAASPRDKIEPVEMSANISSREIPVVLERLGQGKESGSAVDVLPCTNMFSVGVDVQRLGLIVMNGQPKTTAEYIQASSRVGRGDIPGVVVALYPNNKARDRSQYESFIPYHQALYRAVEPTSVTPYARPAMERALHAAIVIVMRYCAGLPKAQDAKKFDKNEPVIKKWLGLLKERFLEGSDHDPKTRNELIDYFDQCVDAWDIEAKSSGSNLYYSSHGASNFIPLLREYEPGLAPKPDIPWATLNSMRNVDQECRVYVRGEK